MRTISEIMTRDVQVVAPDDKVQDAAQLMRDLDIGVVPVCNGRRLVGMLTDRDIAIRAVAQNKGSSDLRVADIMSDRVLWCYADQTAGEILQQMGDEQVRRIPVVDRNMELVGLVSLGDLATEPGIDVENALDEISSPVASAPKRSGKRPSLH